MIIIRGVNVFPNVLANIVESHTQPGDDYQLEAYKKAGVDEVAIKLETREEGMGGVIQRAIQDEIKSRLNLRVEVKVVPKGTLPKFEYKAKRFLDRGKEGQH
jgi:phenylacetate-CoA ligase